MHKGIIIAVALTLVSAGLYLAGWVPLLAAQICAGLVLIMMVATVVNPPTPGPTG